MSWPFSSICFVDEGEEEEGEEGDEDEEVTDSGNEYFMPLPVRAAHANEMSKSTVSALCKSSNDNVVPRSFSFFFYSNLNQRKTIVILCPDTQGYGRGTGQQGELRYSTERGGMERIAVL